MSLFVFKNLFLGRDLFIIFLFIFSFMKGAWFARTYRFFIGACLWIASSKAALNQSNSRSLFSKVIWIDLVYFTTQVPDTSNTSATQTTRVQHECDTNDSSATRVRHEWHECNTSLTRVLHERHECDTSVTRVLHKQREWEILILKTT